MTIKANYVDIPNRATFPAAITFENGKISSIEKINETVTGFAMPGFIDAHIHIESSMLVPTEFARIATVHGTVATVSDPHEIANVLGIDGVKYMIENARKSPLKFHFGAPSCVPATSFETAGDVIDSDGIAELMAHDDIFYLAEMMNYPGVIYDDEEVLRKLAIAKNSGKPIDGHAPGLSGDDLKKYVAAGISTDHECFTLAEAEEKLALGMKILIREGSAAKNFEALHSLLHEHWEMAMFCSDDKHPDDLIDGHIDQLCARAVAKGVDVFKVLQSACLNPIYHYKMNVGKLQIGDAADFIIVEDLKTFKVLETYIDGNLVARDGKSLIEPFTFESPNKFNCNPVKAEDFQVKATSEKVRVIEALEGQLITNEIETKLPVINNFYQTDIENDILKIAVVNRYFDAKPAVAFIKNFGLKRGAIASSVAHDSHNIVVVGVDDESIAKAVNLIVAAKGGVCAVDENSEILLPLPIAGIISDKDVWETARLYQEADEMAKSLGSKLKAPFMTLSFMALLVIPDLKLSDKGLFSGKEFKFVDLGKGSD